MNSIITRSMYCPRCNAREHPYKGDLFVVFGTTRQHLLVRKTHINGTKGFTPHLISWDEPLLFEDGKVKCSICCGINGCGVEVDPTQDDMAEITFIKAEFIYLMQHDFIALRDRFKNSGYEIF
jgi:hypothetical protein